MEDREKLKEIIYEVLSLEQAERQDYLDKANLSAEMRSEIESLISYEKATETFMGLSAVAFSQDLFSEDDSQSGLTGQEIRVYKIVREVGHGGMGTVFLAERADGKFEQKVALKLLKRK